MTTTWARSVAAAVLAWIWPPPSGAHHAMPEDTEAPGATGPATPPDAAVSPAMTTMLDLRALRMRPYVPQQREEQHDRG